MSHRGGKNKVTLPRPKQLVGRNFIDNEPRTFKIKLEPFPNIDAQFANALSVTHSGREFTLSFLQIQTPIALSEADMLNIKDLPVKCVARIVFTPEQMGDALNSMTKNFEKYLKTYAEPIPDAEETEEIKKSDEAINGKPDDTKFGESE